MTTTSTLKMPGTSKPWMNGAEANSTVAGFHGIEPDDEALIDPADIDRPGERVVPIVITPDRKA